MSATGGRHWVRWVVAAVVLLTGMAMLLVVGALMVVTTTGSGQEDVSSDGSGTCNPVLPAGTIKPLGSLDAIQTANATIIIAVGKSLKVTDKGLAISLAVALTESGLRNLGSDARPASYNYDYESYPNGSNPKGDHDSVGLFQQRDAWGSIAKRMDRAKSARMFFTGGDSGQRGLTDIDYESMGVAEAAQTIQVSAYPSAYAAFETVAVKAVNEIGGSTTGGLSIDSGCDTSGGADQMAGIDPNAEWVNPISPSKYTLTARFGSCGGRWANCHTGLDFAVPTGTPVHAMSDGVVESSGAGGSYGNLVKIKHSGNIETYYAHNSVLKVATGATVKAGQVIASSGATGNVTGPHSHIETRLRGNPVNPETFMRQRDVAY